tara:strand:+ start:4118 stop:4552 length:435 start_codon:yes stop_codon:yes gene_type:complete
MDKKKIWFKDNLTIEAIEKWSANTMVDHLDMHITEIGEDFLRGDMPVDHRTVQPQRRLHGGASAALAETLGSIAANLTLNNETHVAFGQTLFCQHLRPGVSGRVSGVARPVHLGRTSQVWEINIETEEGKVVCSSRLTMAVVRK